MSMSGRDIWAFGCLLYELLTGKRAFSGATSQDTIAAVLEREPDWQAFPAARLRKSTIFCGSVLRRTRPPSPEDFRCPAVIDETSPAKRRIKRWRLIAGASVAALQCRDRRHILPARRYYVAEPMGQVDQFARLGVQPALSRDGSTLAFIRGSGAGGLFATGQIYVKRLPDGELVQLTSDDHRKISPVFSPDGSLIAYGTTDQVQWQTWTVQLTGGEPRVWLPNSSGLVWTGARQMLFSEITEGIHMKLVTAGNNRIGERTIYDPPQVGGMAHRSYPSPDGKWVLVVEMMGDWFQCRVVSMDESSPVRQVGPPGSPCTFGAWSPDGDGYLSSSAAARAFTCGGSISRTANPNRSHRVPPTRKVSRWPPMENRWSLPSA